MDPRPSRAGMTPPAKIRAGLGPAAALSGTIAAAILLAACLGSDRASAQRETGSAAPITRPQRLDAWTIVGPGGGGTFYNPAISPFDPDLVVATSDMTDSFLTENGGRTWREFNLRTIAQFVFDRKLANRILAFTAGGGSFYSDDRGHTWRMFYPEPSSVEHIWYIDDEGEPGITTRDGFSYGMTALAVDPEDSNTLYASWGGGLRMTKDLGRHWQDLAGDVTALRLFVDPASPRGRRTVYVVTGGATGIWDGKKYASFKPPFSVWFSNVAIGIGPKGKPVIYAGADFRTEGSSPTGGIMATEDGGQSWHSVAVPLLEHVEKGTFPGLRGIATSREHAEVIYAAYDKWKPAGDSRQYFGIVKTIDGGAHWTVVTQESDTADPRLHDSWVTQRFGPDWGDQPIHMFVDDHNPNLVYATDMARIFRTTDGGANWEPLYSQGDRRGFATTGLDPTTCYGVHFDPFDARRMFISYTDIGLFRSEDGGKSWLSATTRGIPHNWVNTTYWVEFDPAVRGKMWAAMSNNHDIPRIRTFSSKGSTARFTGGVAVSTDGGLSWSKSNQGLPEMAATHIVLDPRSPPEARILYVTGFGRGVFKSTDGGKSWTAKNRGLPAVEPLTWRMALDRNGTLYVVTVRRSQDGQFGNDGDGWVFRSRDGAETWERMELPKGLNGPMAVTPDPDDPARLYLAAWGRYTRFAPTLAEQGGVFLSPDGGRTWANVLSASRRIYDVTIDPQDHNIVYATGFEASAWRSADRGKTWTRIRGFNFKHGHRVIPDPLDRSQIYITTFGSSVWHGPAAGDPNAVEDIVAPPAATFDVPGGGSARHTRKSK